MGRRRVSSSSSSTTGNNKRKAMTDDAAAVASSSTVEQLSMLRSFLGMTTNETVTLCGNVITESDLMDCHRKSGYNVQLAAERLMTGEYHSKFKSNSNTSNKKKTPFFKMVSSTSASSSGSIKTSSSTSSSSTTSIPAKKMKDEAAMTTVHKKKASNAATVSFAAATKAITPATSSKSTAVAATTASKSTCTSSTTATLVATATPSPSITSADGSTCNNWLLCQRWISNAVCTVRSGRLQYQEVLSIEHSYMNKNSSNNKKKETEKSKSSFVTSVRFRGQHVEGRLPENIAVMLSPLLKHDQTMIAIHAQALMQMNGLVTGSEIPISLTVYLVNPHAFFRLFESIDNNNKNDSSSSTGSQFWETQKLMAAKSSSSSSSGDSTTPTARRGQRRRMPLVQQAAFDLLQWAEYGDVPDFKAAAAAAAAAAEEEEESARAAASAGSATTQQEEDEEEEENLVELSEADFDKVGEDEDEASVVVADDDGSTAPLSKEWGAGAENAAALLPEAEHDPIGFKDGIKLCRPYQSQALYWMQQREKGGEMADDGTATTMTDSTVMQEQMNLLSELVASTSARQQQQHQRLPTSQQGEVACDCGPVLVSEKAQTQAKTLHGQAVQTAVSHPLWTRRFLAKSNTFADASNVSFSACNNETICFHVNEVLGVARHEPPEPPSPCRGGILADAMGLGKTVMLLALILASKQERQQAAGLGQTKAAKSSPGTTLIVVKLSMLPQWQDEIESKANLTFSTYYGQQQSGSKKSPDFHNADIVLTTYGTIQGEVTTRRSNNKKQPVLLQHEWLRVILDEAHCVRNTQTLASKACCTVKAQYRWAVSGTLIQNSVEDLFGLMKFLHHEPWCLPPFWKAAITKPMLMTMMPNTTSAGDAKNDASTQDLDKMRREREEAVRMVLDRIRRILAPIMLRRTKDSRTLDGKPILTLPPIETKVVNVELLPAEREFYNGVLARSLHLFEGFVDSGTAARSYLQILSMISRLRQTCDHIALTVRARMDDDDWNASIFERNDDDVASGEDDEENDDGDDKPRGKKASTVATSKQSSRSNTAPDDALGKQFLQGLLAKFCSKPSPRKKKQRSDTDGSAAILDEESPDTKRPRNKEYLSNVATALSQAVESKASHIDEECPICLENPRLDQAAVTPCGHTFCRECLLGFLRENAPKQEDDSGETKKKNMAFHCPDGKCPCCSKPIKASRIVALSKSGENGETLTSSYLTSMKPAHSSSTAASSAENNDCRDNITQACRAARTILDSTMKDVASVESSKMSAIMEELDCVWQVDPGSKVIIFSQFLGFLDLMESRLMRGGIPFYRLDGKLSLKGRMAVLEHFRSCDEQPSLRPFTTRKYGASSTETDDVKDDSSGTSSIKERRAGTVLLMSMSAGGEGLNLVAAQSVFLVDPWWNSAREDQCVNRIHRIGQKASIVRVRKFVTVDTVEESIVQLQSRKKYMADQVYKDTDDMGDGDDDAGGNNNTARLNLDDFKLIFRRESE